MLPGSVAKVKGEKMPRQQVVDLMLCTSIGVGAIAMFSAIGFLFGSDWDKH